MKYIRIYADEGGESHFSDNNIKLELSDFAPPAPPIELSGYYPASRCVFTVFPVGWYGDWHPTPERQIFICFQGILEVTVSDGEKRMVSQGCIVFVEDTEGKGHITKVVSEVEVRAAVIQLQ